MATQRSRPRRQLCRLSILRRIRLLFIHLLVNRLLQMVIRVIDALLQLNTDIVSMTRLRIDDLRRFTLPTAKLWSSKLVIILFRFGHFLQRRLRSRRSSRGKHLLHSCLLLQLRRELLLFLTLHLNQ